MSTNEGDALAVAVLPEAVAAGVVVVAEPAVLDAELLQPAARPARAVSSAARASALLVMRPAMPTCPERDDLR
jgi:hypothetical protein